YWARVVRNDPTYHDTAEKRAAYRGMLETMLADYNVPAAFSFLPWAESHYNPRARNRFTGAAGLWQLMPRTARQYGLAVGGGIDERYDPQKATAAAARYLKDLLSIFGDDDFLLVLAAYNAGDGAILYSLKRIPDPVKDRNFWYLVQHDLIPEETQRYVLKIVALMALEEGATE
ncbi:MAG TPA: lytic transglycosylase domain-containing protein, partial [Spirochaetia bacterium]|nr:lytic transglycosylase domain-containing protein [Spirochaetia bacterium]